MNAMDTVFANTNFADEAENYIWHGITERDKIEADVRECLKEYNATEDDVQEYTDNVYEAVLYAMRRENDILK